MELEGSAAAPPLVSIRQDTAARLDSPAGDSLQQRVQALRLPDAPPRRRVGKWVAAVLVLALLGAGGWYGYPYLSQYLPRGVTAQGASTATLTSALSPAPAAPASSLASSGDMGQPAALNAAKPAGAASAPAAGSVALESKGYVIAAHQILVSPRVSGMVVYLNADEGRRVNKGDVLAKIESVEYESDYDDAVAALELSRQRLKELKDGNRPEEIAEAQAELGESEALLTQLASDWKRKQDLKSTGVLTATELEMAESQFHSTQHKVERLRAALKLMQIGARPERIAAQAAEVKQREAELLKTRWRLDNCTILAPIAGTILTKNAGEGEVVDAHVMQGSYSLCEMADLSDIEIELKVQERDIARVRVGQKCQVRAEAYPDRVYQGFVSRLMPIADQAKAAVPVRVKVNVPAQDVGVYLKPQMGAIVTFFN